MGKGLVHIYCGDGKGKTSAALGLALRAAGHDFRVVFVQFLKPDASGELNSLAKIPQITVVRGELPKGFSWTLSSEQLAQLCREHDRIFAQAVALCGDGKDTLLILDEMNAAYGHSYIDREKVLQFLQNKPAGLEVVLTGRNPDLKLCECADYITEMKKVKHPMDCGIAARIGIEL